MFWNFIVGLATGVLSGFGIGGGSLLILWLTTAAGVQQYQAGGVNLLYFICCAPAALWSHIKNHLVDRQAVVWCTLFGLPTSVAAAYFASMIDVNWLRRGFGVLLLYIGIREITCKKENTNKDDSQNTPAKC